MRIEIRVNIKVEYKCDYSRNNDRIIVNTNLKQKVGNETES